jgi:hypothetical protein
MELNLINFSCVLNVAYFKGIFWKIEFSGKLLAQNEKISLNLDSLVIFT